LFFAGQRQKPQALTAADRPQIDTVIRMNEGAAQLTLDGCELTFSDTLTLQVAVATFANVLHFAGGVTVAGGTTLSVTSATVSFDKTCTPWYGVCTPGLIVQSEGKVDITHSSISFGAGAGTGLDVQEGGAATATGTTFTVADDTTVAWRVPEGYTFAATGSQLIGADGGAAPLWPAEVARCDCGGRGPTCVSPRGECECAAFPPALVRTAYPASPNARPDRGPRACRRHLPLPPPPSLP
jgi:hypothetical protein